MKTALITGIHGMDGFYLSKLLLEKGYRVVGVYRRTSSPTSWRLAYLSDELKRNLILEAGDITDYSSIARIVRQYQPDEFYNLAAQSQVWHSFKAPLATMESTAVGAMNCLEAVRQECPDCKFYQASSSEMFGNSAINGDNKPTPGVLFKRILDEESPMIPRSPYGIAKLAAHNAVRNYREAYSMFAVGGILFNHEGPFRGTEFVTRKITNGIAAVLADKQDNVALGNLDSYRDWGHAADYMRAAWMMLQADEPKDYVISTGETHSVQNFIIFSSICVAEHENWSRFIKRDPSLVRPAEVDILIGNSSKARQELKWMPEYSFESLVYEMMKFDLSLYGIDHLLLPLEHVLELWGKVKTFA